MKNPLEKTILAVWHSSGKGKSETLRHLALLLLKEYPNHLVINGAPGAINPSQDFRLVLEIDGQTIGIESQGDPGTQLQDRLLQLATKSHCDVIVCTCRTRGETVYAVNHLASKGFQIIWTSTYQVSDPQQQMEVNQLKARHILELLRELKILRT